MEFNTIRFIIFLMCYQVSFGNDSNTSKRYSDKAIYNVSHASNLFRDSSQAQVDNYGLKCTVRPIDPTLHATITSVIQKQAKLVEYVIDFVGNCSVNPLLVNQTYSYKSNHWARVGSSHGATILTLAFNYDILSLMTLSFGTEKIKVDLEDLPSGCIGTLSESERIQVVLDILLRDLKEGGEVVVHEGESSVCHQVISARNGSGKFTDRCCAMERHGTNIICSINESNQYLKMLDLLLMILTVVVMLLGPALTPGWLYTSVMEKIPYYIKLKEPLYKKLVVTSREDISSIKATHKMYVNYGYCLRNFYRLLCQLPFDVIVPIKIDQFDIDISYRKMLKEGSVPVGVTTSLYRAIFQCKLQEMGVFEDCCTASVSGCKHVGKPWKFYCNFIGHLLLVIFLPLPFYLRLMVYYIFENPEVMERSKAASNVNLTVDYEFRMMQYLTPTHPIYLTMYVVYFATGLKIAYASSNKQRPHVQNAIMNSFLDMKNASKLGAVQGVVATFLWPFRKFGCFGVFVGVLYWPLIMPFITIPVLLYCIPLIHLVSRIWRRVFIKHPMEICPLKPEDLRDLSFFQRLTKELSISRIKWCRFYSHNVILNGFLCFVAIFTLVASMSIFAEVIRFTAEIMCFTVMGLIVNAAKVIKYGSLMFMVLLYSRECYNEVNREYLKLNKALFGEVHNRLRKDIEEFTQLPVEFQENRGFKAFEASQQGEYEVTDDIVKIDQDPFNWNINDLILFIDKHDTPRMPKKLFDQVCELRVAGCPGPVYKSLIWATGKFLFIICFLLFIFIVVMSFGEANNFSTTSQMLAAMAGGFLPLIFNNFLKSATPTVESNLLSFRAKVNEVINNFVQVWPMNDFLFDIEEEPKSEEEDSDEEVTDNEDINEGEEGESHARKTEKDKKADNKDREDKKKDKDIKEKSDKKDSEKDDKLAFKKTIDVDINEVTEKLQKLDLIPLEEDDEVDIVVQMLDWNFHTSSIDMSNMVNSESKTFVNGVQDLQV